MPALLAAITDADQGNLLLYICSGFLALAVFLDRVVSIWKNTRKCPGDAEMYVTLRQYAADQARVEARLDALDCETGRSIKAITTTLETELRKINYSLGRLEGQIIATATGMPQPIIGHSQNPH